ncbi:DUF1579 domain-containing protein [Candidatus Nitronereus thalassa]|uniref:DUF1579 domain-containing protein n=1 Tax=Candidatus Nitronereus thalassa TaxID=3020898 RepID=A0ABU3KAZ3_9BACT|nr:DUF1579 domain-containing protein [Candidatus Nitronereus thalassa]MDT7043579.1 DUF1579 domain-containing protein [Candidatus Nitronereus thalassa]
MRFMNLALICFFLVMTTVPGHAGEKHSDMPMDMQKMMEMYQKMATPGEPHTLFASLAGSWTTHMKEWMEPGKPPMESTGSAELKMLLGGRFLYQEITGQMMGQPFSGIGIDAYDNIQQKYVTAWMDTMATGIFMMEGTASPDGKTITLTGHHEAPGGGHMSHRAVWTLVDANTQTFVMYGTHPGSSKMKMMELTYTRKH